jgi:hypothetical protein
MNDLTIPRGDKLFVLEFTITKADDSPFPLTGYTVAFIVWPVGKTGGPIVNGSCTIKDAPNGVCEYTVQDGDFDRSGVYDFELELSKIGSKESTQSYRLLVTESP